MNTEKITELIQFLTKNPGYLKRGKENLAALLDSTTDEVQEAKDIVNGKKLDWATNEKIGIGCPPPPYNISIGSTGIGVECPEGILDLSSKLHNDLNNKNESEIKEFSQHLEKLGLKEEDVKSVKFWQTQGGDIRYSIVTKNDGLELPSLEDVTKELVTKIEPTQLPKVKETTGDILVVFLSDKHIGALTKPEAMYDNPYNEEELQNRLIKVVSEIANTYTNRSEFAFEEIVLIDLGDALDGYNAQTTRGGHTLPQNMTNKEAFEVFIRLHKAFYNALFLSGFAKSYSVYHVSNSNHGGEFEHFATRCLQEYLTCSYPEVKFELLDKFITPISISNHTYLLSHGKDTEDMKQGLPLCLDAKTENYIKDYVLEKGISTKNLHFVKGDLHQAGTQWGKHFRYRNVPSMYGSSKWIMTNFGLTKPGCSFDLIEGNSIKQWELWF